MDLAIVSRASRLARGAPSSRSEQERSRAWLWSGASTHSPTPDASFTYALAVRTDASRQPSRQIHSPLIRGVARVAHQGALAAAKLGAALVVATDGQLRAVELAAHNLHANTQPLVPAGGKKGEQLLSRYRAEQLRWGNQDDIERVRALSPDGGGYDLIIGSDLIYFGAHAPHCLPPLHNHSTS